MATFKVVLMRRVTQYQMVSVEAEDAEAAEQAAYDRARDNRTGWEVEEVQDEWTEDCEEV